MTFVFDDCPYCGKEIEEDFLTEEYHQMDGDTTYFETECPHCKKEIGVQVHYEDPTFYLNKPEDMRI